MPQLTNQQCWDIITETFREEILQANSEYPNTRSVHLDWEQIDAADGAVAKNLLTMPSQTRDNLRKAIAEWDEVSMEGIEVRVQNIPDDRNYRVGKVRTRHLGTAIGVTGEVAEIDPVKPFAEVAAFKHRTCGTINRVAQSYGPIMRPMKCMGCENKGTKKEWLFVREQSKLKDVREVVLKRRETNLDDDAPVLKLRLTGDLVERLGPGDHVSLVGRYDSGAFQKQSILETYLDVWAIENHEEGVMMDELPPEELQDMVVEEIEALQEEDASDFGADKETVVDNIEDEGVRRSEVESALDDLLSDGPVDEIAGNKVMVTR